MMRASSTASGRRPIGIIAATVVVLGAALPAAAAPDAAQTYLNDLACSRMSTLSARDCGKAYALARAEFLARTKSYPSRIACYQAYGPCIPWPIGGGRFAHFRPQLMGMTLAGSAGARTVVPVIAAGRTKLALVPHNLSDPLPAASVADAPRAPATIFAGGAATETLCRQIADGAARANLPPAFLARLLWQESSFRPHVVSRAGALGIAQFMPGTALERGLDDPFDAAQAITTSAALLGDLKKRFGNLGLAAAAYNGGPARVTGWLQGRRSLAAETESYVRSITGRTVQDWAHATADAAPALPGPCFAPAPQAAR